MRLGSSRIVGITSFLVGFGSEYGLVEYFMPSHVCAHCGTTFQSSSTASRFCHRHCYTQWRAGRFTGADNPAARRNATRAFTPDQMQVVYGSLLGDGSLGKPANGINYHLTLAHSVNQLDYLRWKHALLSPLASEPRAHRRPDPRYGRTYETWRFHTPSLPSLTALYAECYPGGRKRLPRSLLDRCGALALAIWYMDDGSQTKGSPSFASVCFSAEDVDEACRWFAERWGINAHRSPDNRIDITGPTRTALVDAIAPYVPACMTYKLPTRWDAERAVSGQFKRNPALDRERNCIICGAHFLVKDQRARACSQRCKYAVIKMVRRGEIPAIRPGR